MTLNIDPDLYSTEWLKKHKIQADLWEKYLQGVVCMCKLSLQEALSRGYCCLRWFNVLLKHCCHYFSHCRTVCLMGVFYFGDDQITFCDQLMQKNRKLQTVSLVFLACVVRERLSSTYKSLQINNTQRSASLPYTYWTSYLDVYKASCHYHQSIFLKTVLGWALTGGCVIHRWFCCGADVCFWRDVQRGLIV